MIASEIEYLRANEELENLGTWLKELQGRPRSPENGLTLAGVRKMIARTQEELGVYEGSLALVPESVSQDP